MSVLHMVACFEIQYGILAVANLTYDLVVLLGDFQGRHILFFTSKLASYRFIFYSSVNKSVARMENRTHTKYASNCLAESQRYFYCKYIKYA